MKKSILILFILFINIITIKQGNTVSNVKNSPTKPTYHTKSTLLTYPDISRMDIKEIEQTVGYKLKWKEKIALKLTKRQIKKFPNRYPSTQEFNIKASGNGLGIASFILGFILGLIGVLIAHLAFEKAHAKYSWTGFFAWLLLFLVIFVL